MGSYNKENWVEERKREQQEAIRAKKAEAQISTMKPVTKTS